jgi:sulfide dehydrogenase [flavocytochrome c] flavoprotein chain
MRDGHSNKQDNLERLTSMNTNRRQFLGSAAAGASLLAMPAIAHIRPRVVVVGGGPGGATAAKYVARETNGTIDVVLVEPSRQFTTCFHSNLYLGGFRTWDSITHSYDKLAATYGIRMNHQMAAGVDRVTRQVVMADGSRLSYDRLILSPGIDIRYDSVAGWGQQHEEAMPHAWKAGPQTQLLKTRLDAVPDGGLIVMVAPPVPYRCPPGPYERVSMMAHVLKKAGKTRAKIVVLDPKERFSKKAGKSSTLVWWNGLDQQSTAASRASIRVPIPSRPGSRPTRMRPSSTSFPHSSQARSRGMQG